VLDAIYFLFFIFVLRIWSFSSPAAALGHFGRQLETGYDQLYFLIVIMEFYLVFPLVLALLRRTNGHHGLVIAATVAAQFAMSIGMHWKLLPPAMITYGQENALCYVLYLIGGAVVALHLSEVHHWVVRNAPLVVFGTVASAVFAEGVYFLARDGVRFAVWAPFWVWFPLTLAIAYFGSIALTAVLARTPLAVPLTGRSQQPWRTLLPRRVPAPAAAPATAPAPAAAADPVTPSEPAALAGTTTDQNGTRPC
jgi:hypothetical protein